MNPGNINKGIILILLVTILQASILTITKLVSHIITTGMQVFAYCAIPLFFYIPKIFKHGLKYYKTGHYWVFSARGIFSASAVFCFFYAAKHIQLGVASIFYNSSPIFIPLLAVFFLNEKTSILVYFSILLAMAGVIIIIHPGYNNFISPVIFIALISGLLMAMQQTMLRYLAKKSISADKILFYQCVTCTLASILILIIEKIFWNGVSITKHFSLQQIPITIFVIMLLGTLSYIAQYLVTRAFGYMPASKLAPFLLFSVPISSLFGWIFWQQKFTSKMLLGSIFILTGILIISLEKNLFVKKYNLPKRKLL